MQHKKIKFEIYVNDDIGTQQLEITNNSKYVNQLVDNFGLKYNIMS